MTKIIKIIKEIPGYKVGDILQEFPQGKNGIYMTGGDFTYNFEKLVEQGWAVKEHENKTN